MDYSKMTIKQLVEEKEKLQLQIDEYRDRDKIQVCTVSIFNLGTAYFKTALEAFGYLTENAKTFDKCDQGTIEEDVLFNEYFRSGTNLSWSKLNKAEYEEYFGVDE